MHRFAIGCVLALVATPLAAEQAREWVFDDNPEMPILQYGAPESDDILFAVTCEPKAKKMTVVESRSDRRRRHQRK